MINMDAVYTLQNVVRLNKGLTPFIFYNLLVISAFFFCTTTIIIIAIII